MPLLDAGCGLGFQMPNSDFAISKAVAIFASNTAESLRLRHRNTLALIGEPLHLVRNQLQRVVANQDAAYIRRTRVHQEESALRCAVGTPRDCRRLRHPA